MPNTEILKSYQLDYELLIYFVFRAETEVWQLSNGNNKVINPTFSSGYYANGIGIYSVDFDYCRKN